MGYTLLSVPGYFQILKGILYITKIRPYEDTLNGVLALGKLGDLGYVLHAIVCPWLFLDSPGNIITKIRPYEDTVNGMLAPGKF